MRSPGGELKSQRGAIGIMAALTLFMVILFAVLAVDSGRLWLEQRRLQNVADMAAIEASQIGGCKDNVDIAAAREAAERAALANEPSLNGLLSTANAVQLGSIATVSGERIFTAGGSPEAVKVIASRAVPASLVAGGFFGQNINLQAEAVAPIRTAWAAFSAGSTTLNLDTNDSWLLNSLLTKVLGTSISLPVASWQGLANSSIKLLNLVKASALIGSVDDLLDANVTVGEFLTLLEAAARADGNQLDAVNQTIVLDGLLNLAQGAVNNTTIKIGDVLNVTNPDPNAVLATQVNLLQLINTAVIVANGKNFIDIPLGIPSLLGLSVTTRIGIIEAPQIAVGGPGEVNGSACTEAKPAAVRVVTILEGGLLGLVASTKLQLLVKIAPGYAKLQAIKVGEQTTDVEIDAKSGLAEVFLTSINPSCKPLGANPENCDRGSEDGEIIVLNALGLVQVGGARVRLDLPAVTSEDTLVFHVNRPTTYSNTPTNECEEDGILPDCKTTYAGLGKSLQGATEGALRIRLVTVCVLGACILSPVDTALNAVTGVVSEVLYKVVVPLLANVSRMVLDPLLKLLGINTAGLTVVLDDVQSANRQSLLRGDRQQQE
ncbi:Uncharacterized membrane protein [Methylobacillus rhizosphaerae]|uniref:Uncharacterized membrane protein n=1 Tax=Methylobacillus rhizosphaerae TaxID=551994 RepID=A0A238YKA8_9PROT|nr:TadG family pilus assembly protein [Methylobacillus rhizosphaerae]SNR71557.1 Uncharacterized membrane protein [Methylobacillus rhizosphaerae]